MFYKVIFLILYGISAQQEMEERRVAVNATFRYEVGEWTQLMVVDVGTTGPSTIYYNALNQNGKLIMVNPARDRFTSENGFFIIRDVKEDDKENG